MITTVLIDDERTIQLTLKAVLERHGHEVHVGATASQGLKKIAEVRPDLVLLDLDLPDADGLDVLREIKAARPDQPVIVLTAHDSLENAIKSIKLGAFHFVAKPYAAEDLMSLCARAIEQRALSIEAASLRAEKADLQTRLRAAEKKLAPVAASRRMREIDEFIGRIAPSDANVLLTGESGVGKEVFAGEIHRLSTRAHGPMVRLNCAAFPANMVEAELFGYTKGAFTGASAAFPGMIAQAQGGTLFLDEITEMPVEVQARFLRVVQEREYRPLGSIKNIAADFRLIAASNRPISAAVSEGRLRHDLYFRLKTFEIEIPPLRERREDIAKLTVAFMERFSTQHKQPPRELPPETLELLRDYPWPGNVRELQNAIQHAIVLCHGPVLTPNFLPREIQAPKLTSPATPEPPRTLEDIERQAIINALQQTGGNIKRAAAELGIHRTTLHAKLTRLGIPRRGKPEP